LWIKNHRTKLHCVLAHPSQRRHTTDLRSSLQCICGRRTLLDRMFFPFSKKVVILSHIVHFDLVSPRSMTGYVFSNIDGPRIESGPSQNRPHQPAAWSAQQPLDRSRFAPSIRRGSTASSRTLVVTAPAGDRSGRVLEWTWTWPGAPCAGLFWCMFCFLWKCISGEFVKFGFPLLSLYLGRFVIPRFVFVVEI